MTTISTFGQLVRERRLAKGMSMGQLASSVGRTAASVRRWERDEVVPGRDVVERLAEVLDLAPGELAAATASHPPPVEAASDAEPTGSEEDGRDEGGRTDALPVAAPPPPVPPPAPPPPAEAATALSPEVEAVGDEGSRVRYYLDHLFDPDRPYLGYLRATLTVVVGFVLLWILIVTVGSLFAALGEVWDQFEREETETTVGAAVAVTQLVAADPRRRPPTRRGSIGAASSGRSAPWRGR